MHTLTTRALDEHTWPDFARLVEKHKGVWGGCWCMAFHAEGIGRGRTPAQNRADKERRVCEGRAHAALVYDGTDCVGWCQFGSPEELPRIKHRRAYEAARDAALKPAPAAAWRITCFFVDKDHRGQGVAAAALKGALREIARLGGGVVESVPEGVAGRKVPAAFLFGSSVELFEREGFVRQRPLGKHHWLVTRRVRAAAGSRKL